MGKKLILVVDDAPDTIKLIKFGLEKHGYDVLTATSGREALELACDEKPDLVLMDIVLKGKMDGIEAAGQINSRFNIPVIYLTAYTEDEKLARAKVTEPFGYIIKPFEDRELRFAIEIGLYKAEMENELKSLAKKLEISNQKLQASKVSFHNIVEKNADGIIVVDGKGIVRFVNPAAEALFGKKAKDFLGELFGFPFAASKTVEIDIIRNGTETGIGELRITEIEWESEPAYLVSIIDITEQKKAREKIESMAKFPRENPNPVLRISNDGVVLFANEASWPVLRTLGIQQGQRLPDNFYKRIEEVVRSGKPSGFEFHCFDGLIFLVTFAIVKKFDYVNVYGLDITKLKQTEEKLKLAKNEAEAANEVKSQFLANMSHELRTPMNAIMGFCQILADKELPDEQRDYINIINDNSKHLLQIIDDILDFSKIEVGKIGIETAECSLKQLFAIVESTMRTAAMKKGLEFGIRQDDGLPADIYTAPARLQQCLINLVNNAIKFTKKGHVYVNVSSEERNNQLYIRFDV
ncbi:MAG: histidine kinase dimerization/phospho-acceptor domain-containing protein [Phycisphaerae bacterium]|jgi:signal transduction histidine kinase/DNA-binding NarL/FixJ family response regulator